MIFASYHCKSVESTHSGILTYHLPDVGGSDALNDLGDYATMNMLPTINVGNLDVHFRTFLLFGLLRQIMQADLCRVRPPPSPPLQLDARRRRRRHGALPPHCAPLRRW